MDSESEQTFHGPGSVAGFGTEPTSHAGISATHDQPQGKNLALSSSNDGNISENANPRYVYLLAHQPRAKLPKLVLQNSKMLGHSRTSGTVSTVPFTQTCN